MASLVLVEKVKGGIIYEDGYFRIDNCRVSFPHLARPYKGKDDNGDPKKKGSYGIVGMLEDGKPHGEIIEAMEEYIDDLIAKNKGGKVSADRRFLRNGDDGDREEYEGHMIVSARESKRPSVRDGDGELLDPVDDEERIEELIYGGCYCDILIRVWYQDGVKVGKGYGKRVNAGLVGVKYRGEGESFGEGRIDDSAAWDEGDGGSSRSSRRNKDDDDGDSRSSRSSRRNKDDDGDSRSSRSSRSSRNDDNDDL
jgi:hypothetical protein